MNRRDFIRLLGGAAGAYPLAARAQQAKMPVIGFLGSASQASWSALTPAFVQRLAELGWIEGRTIAIEYRWADGRDDRIAQFAAEFVKLGVDIIVTSGGAVRAVQRITAVVPIVFAIASDPVGAGMAASLARPGGNATGLSIQSSDLAGKRLELLRELRPAIRSLAIICNATNAGSVLEIGQAENAARALGLDVIQLDIRDAEQISPGIDGLGGRADALYVCADPLTNAAHARINAAALQAGLIEVLPTMTFMDGGGLMSYGPSYQQQFRRAADFVDRILRGAKPADLPVEQPTKFELVINLKTAKTLGLTIPPTVLALADEVIE